MNDKIANILLEFVQGKRGAEWLKERNGWNNDTYVCLWEGIICNAEGHVTEINLVNTGLTATIPESLTKLVHLKHLFLSENKIYGTIPPSLGNALPELISIDFYENMLRGPVPKMSNPNLELVNFSHNRLSARLPDDFGDGLSRLRVLNIGHNVIGGTIPESLGAMIGLKALNLASNAFHGTIPESLGALIKLQILFLSENKLVGGIPSSLTRDFLSLREIFLHDNFLSGSLPVSLADLPNLKVLSINDNKLSGTIPVELCLKKLNEVFRVFSATGRNDDASMNSEDNCDSVACPVGYRSDDGVFSCTRCSNGLVNPYLGANKCYDRDHGAILKKLYDATDGRNWAHMGDAAFTGIETWDDDSVPPCKKYGVKCNSAGDIIEIRLSKMNLSGTIPEELGFLRHVKVLDLSDNSLYGNFPSELRFLPLNALNISGNLLSGPVPPEVCRNVGVNGNGENGDLNCDVIACAVGTYSRTGNAVGNRCIPCKDALYLGSKECVSHYRNNESSSSALPIYAGLLMATFLVLFSLILVKNL
mmetsp:Transcript_36500/g.44619  ORF Transcript_36500/g.44619 Transcript_36500/m.44619 type:complete len:534 (-) Transcript_36500:12-1613(-)